MSGRWALPYWAAAGALAGFGLVAIPSVGWPFLVLGVAMALVGVPLLGRRGAWGLPLGLCLSLAAVFTLAVVADLLRDGGACFAGVPRGAGTVVCGGSSGGYLAAAPVFWALAAAVGFGLLLRGRGS